MEDKNPLVRNDSDVLRKSWLFNYQTIFSDIIYYLLILQNLYYDSRNSTEKRPLLSNPKSIFINNQPFIF